MATNDTSSDVAQLRSELDEALSALDLALLEAGRSVSIVRTSVTRVFELAERADEMQSAIISAREQLALAFQHDSSAPPLRALPVQDDSEEEQPEEQEAPEADLDAEPVLEPEMQDSPDEDDEPEEELEEEPEPASVATRCLRLKVSKKSGSLDLKDVDGSVNENSSVMDVALLDYDGRKATLKLWVNERADPNGVREALLTSLRTHLGEDETDFNIEFEEDSAA